MQLWDELDSELRGVTEQYIEPINSWAYERREPHVVRPVESGIQP